MNCAETTFNSTKFLIGRKVKNVNEAKQFCISRGFKLAKIKTEDKIQEIFKDCITLLDRFIVDQVNDNKNPGCFVLFQKSLESGTYVRNLACNSEEKYNFVCSKFVSPASTSSLTTTEAAKQIEQSSNWFLIVTILAVLAAAAFIGFTTCCLKKFCKTRENQQQNIEMQPLASTSADTVSSNI